MKGEKEKNRESLDQIIKRIAGNSNNYYGKQYRRNNKV
jgi:hypothetical protein